MPTLIITYTKKSETGTIFNPSGNCRFQQPIQFENGKNQKFTMRCSRLSVPRLIPNILSWSGDGFTIITSVFDFSFDGGANWIQIRLADGSYTVSNIRDAIRQTSAFSDHFSNVNEGFNLYTNTALGIVFFKFDETKLINPAETMTMRLNPTITSGIGINTVSSFWDLLGFTGTNRTFSGTGVHAGDRTSKIDYLGNEVSVELNGLSSNLAYSILNGAQSLICYSMRLGSYNLYGNNYVEQNYWSKPFDINPRSPIESISFAFKSLDGLPILCLGGTFSIDIEFSY